MLYIRNEYLINDAFFKKVSKIGRFLMFSKYQNIAK